MVKKLLKNEVKRLREELKNSKKLYKEIDEYSGELYDKAMVSSLEITELKKEICELQKSVDVLKSERPKNYGMKQIVDGVVSYFCKHRKDDTGGTNWTFKLSEAKQMSYEAACAITITTDNEYHLFQFPPLKDLLEINERLTLELAELKLELAELKLDSTHLVQLFLSYRQELEAELAELKLDSIPNDDIIGIDKTEQYGTDDGEKCGRPCVGVMVDTREGSCSCNVSAPCGHCTTLRTVCDTCEVECFESH